VTEVVPAPDEPVMAMMGCLTDMAQAFRINQSRNKVRSANKGLSISRDVGSLW